MSTAKTKKIAALALSLCMATGAVATVGYASMSSGHGAFAKTANYAVEEGYIGFGENNQATGITVTKEAPATLTLEGVPTGTYNLIVKADFEVPEDAEEVYPELSFMFNDSEYSRYLSYNYYLGYYVVAVSITEETKTVTFTTETDLVYTVEAYFDNLFIGQSNDYIVPDVELVAGSPVTLKLENVEAGDYFLLLNLWFSVVPEGATFTAKVDDGEEVTLEKNDIYWNGYTGEITVTEESTSITVSTTSEEALVGDVSIEKNSHVVPLPEEDTLELYQPVTYSYMAEDTGYFTINVTGTDVEDAVFGVTIRTVLEDFGGTSVEPGMPVYLEAYREYYIEVSYQGTPYVEDEDGVMVPSPAQVTAKIAVDYWQAPTIKAYEGSYYVPVTTALNPYYIDMAVKNGTYTLAVTNVPFFAYMAGATVLAHVGFNTVVLTPANGYTAEVTINGETSIWLTTDYGEDMVLGVAFSGEAEILELDEAKEVTLSGANQTALFALELEAGEYSIVILEGEALIQVTVDGEVILPYGEFDGSFTIKVPESDPEDPITSTGVSILIEYEGTEEFTFTIMVTK